jgi:signal transduction histidine kinase
VRVRLAWTLFAVTVLVAVTQVTFLALSETPMLSVQTLDEGFPLVTVGAVAASAVGALIVTRYPRHRIGWLFIVGQLGTMLGLATQAYGYYVLAEGVGSRASGQLSLWVSGHLGGTFALTLMALLLLLVPDGHLLSRRWRWAVAVTMLALVLHVAGWLTVPPSELTAEGIDPERHQAAQVLVLLAVVAVVVGLVAGTVSLVIRLRRATGDERAQLSWVAAAAVALAVSVPLGVLLSLLPGAGPWVSPVTVMVAYLCVPVFTGIAILRFRLYEIDLFLNRSIVLTLLTGVVATAYVFLVVLFGELDDTDGESFWGALLATVLVALAFQPLRRRVNRLADRLVYGARAAPYEALAEFSDELGRGGQVTAVLSRVAEAVGQAVGARHTEVWIDIPGHEPADASWPDPSPTALDVVLPVTTADGSDPLGGLGVTMPPRRPLRPSESSLLGDLAAQLAKSFQSTRLEAELARQVDLLARRSGELATSSRRLVSAEAAERSRFESAIAREVLPHVQTMPQQLTALAARSTTNGQWPREEVEGLVAGTNAALESLRTLTRGVFPAQLAHRGLAAALTTHARRSERAARLIVDDSVTGRRFDPGVESAAYFCAVELVRSLEEPVQITVAADSHLLRLEAVGRSEGTLEAGYLSDRAQAVGGTLRTARDDGTVRVVVELSAVSAADGLPSAAEEVGLDA